MRRQIQKSHAIDRISEKTESLPPFINNESQTSKFDNSKNYPELSKEQASISQKQSKNHSRARIIFARIFQNLAYICMAFGIGAILCVVVSMIIIYLPQSETSNIIVEPGVGGGGWFIIMVGGLAPRFMSVFQIVIGVIGILIFIWMWRTAVRVTRKLVWRISDEVMKPLSVIEPIFLLTSWTIGIVGVWWLADAEFFLPLTVVCIVFLGIGMISLGLMRKLSGRKLDFIRADLVKR